MELEEQYKLKPALLFSVYGKCTIGTSSNNKNFTTVRTNPEVLLRNSK